MKEEVDAEDIAEAVAKSTGIPVSKMLQSEKEKLLNLEDELHKTGSWAGRGDRRGSRCDQAEPGGVAGPQSGRSDPSFSLGRRVSVRPSWRRRWPIICSMTKYDDPDRHERIPGKAFCKPDGRRASGLCRL
jgi:hypothetical protein